MCRICGRMVKCFFDTMPSRVPTVSSARTFSTTARNHAEKSTTYRMSSKAFLRPTLRNKPQSQISLPTFVLPLRAKLHQATTTQQAVPSSSQPASDIPPSMLQTSQPVRAAQSSPSDLALKQPQPSKPLVLSKSVQQLLPLLSAQTPHYITAHVHRFPYLITAGDTLRLPFHMHGVNSGDILRLNRASILGSRDYTLKAGTSSTELYDKKRTGEPNYLDERMFEVRARVMGIESGPMTIKEKTKRRNRKTNTVRSKHRYTLLRIMEVRVKSLEELQQEKGTLLLES